MRTGCRGGLQLIPLTLQWGLERLRPITLGPRRDAARAPRLMSDLPTLPGSHPTTTAALKSARFQHATRVANGHNPPAATAEALRRSTEMHRISRSKEGPCGSEASASLMTDAVGGRVDCRRPIAVRALTQVVTTPIDEPVDESGGSRRARGGPRIPGRVKCASLAWHTLKAALEGADAPVKTE
jgi:nitrogen fixation NifU-like protein